MSGRSRTLGPSRIAPLDAVQKIAQLRRRDRNGSPGLADRPNEFACLEPLQIERHSHPIAPQPLDQVTLAAAETEDLTAMRIAIQALLHLARQAVHPTAHVCRKRPQSRPSLPPETRSCPVHDLNQAGQSQRIDKNSQGDLAPIAQRDLNAVAAACRRAASQLPDP